MLRLLLVLLSRQIYVPPSALFTSPSQYTLHFVRSLARRDVLTVLCSLMNTAMNAGQQPANVMGTVTGRLPYNHLLLKGEDPRTSLVSTCFQVLCILLDFQSGPARDEATGPTAKTNAFRYFIAKLVSYWLAGDVLNVYSLRHVVIASAKRLCLCIERHSRDLRGPDGLY